MTHRPIAPIAINGFVPGGKLRAKEWESLSDTPTIAAAERSG